QKRPRPAILLGEPHQGPVIEPFALAAETGGKPPPCLVGQTLRNRVYPMLRQIRLPQALIRSHRQHIRHLPSLQEPAQFAIVAVHLVGGNPSRRGARTQCPPDHAPRHLRLGGKLHRLRNPGLPAAFSILSPLLRNVKLPGPPAPSLDRWHSRETRQSGCSRCAPPCRYIDASHPPNVDPSSENPSHRR